MRSFPISDLLDGVPTIKIVDIGPPAGPDAEPVYKSLLKRGLGRVVAFNPDEAACRELNGATRGRIVYLPHIIGNGEPRTLYRLSDGSPGVAYQPDEAIGALFQSLEDHMTVHETQEIETRALDHIVEARGTDYLRLDAEGGDLLIYSGAERVLSEAVVVHTRIAFVPLLRRQPLFSDVDPVLRKHGLQFHRLIELGGRTFKPLVANENVNAALSQFLWADAIYVRDFADFDDVEPERLLKLAVILHEVYRSFDLAALALRHFDKKSDSALWDAYIRRLTGTRPPKG